MIPFLFFFLQISKYYIGSLASFNSDQFFLGIIMNGFESLYVSKPFYL